MASAAIFKAKSRNINALSGWLMKNEHLSSPFPEFLKRPFSQTC